MLLALGALAWTAFTFDFEKFGPYDASVPTPEKILGYGPGERHSTYREQDLVLQQIADHAKGRVRWITFGKSTEGRPLRVLIFASPSNMARLEQIRQQMSSVARGEAPKPDLPAIVWVNECIHGNETASFESAMWLCYNLAASRSAEISKDLENVVVIVNPSFNPDGHERYVVWYNSVSSGTSFPDAYERGEPRIVHGRTNHYRFDMNRDRVAFSQDETRQEVAEFLRWNPQVYIDQHGQVSSYFFPPNPMAVNVNTDRKRLEHWTDIFGRATASAFDRNGFLYYIRDQYDFYYPGYLDTYAALSGAIGMTHETDGGKNLREEQPDGYVLTLTQGMAKHFTSALAVISSAAAHRKELLDSYSEFKSAVTSGRQAGKFQRVVLTSPDPRPLRRLADQLKRGGIASHFVRGFTQPDAHDYWSDKTGSEKFPDGSLVVDMAQPQGAMAKSLLEPGSDFEPDFVKNQLAKKDKQIGKEKYPRTDGYDFYDMTGWSLPFAHNLKAWWCESAPATTEMPFALGKASAATSTVGWYVPYRDRDDLLQIARLMGEGLRVQLLTKAGRYRGSELPAGTFFISAMRNEPGAIAALQKSGLSQIAVDSAYPEVGNEGPGSESVDFLKKPNIAICFGDGDQITDFGAMWYLLDREFKLDYTPIRNSQLSDLGKFSCVVMPSGNYSVTEKFKEWVRQGGVAVVLGSANWAVGEGGFVTMDSMKVGDRSPVSIPGSIFKAELDTRYYLAFGIPHDKEKIPFAVPVSGSQFWKTKDSGGGVVTFPADEKATKLLSGWSWPEDTEKALAGTVWLHDQPYGRGHVILFSEDPTDRAMWPGLYSLLLNAMLLGPRN